MAQIIHSCKCGLYVGQRDHWSPKVHVLNHGLVECVLRDHVQPGLVLPLLPLGLLLGVHGGLLLGGPLLVLDDPPSVLVGPDVAVERLAVASGRDHSVLGQKSGHVAEWVTAPPVTVVVVGGVIPTLVLAVVLLGPAALDRVHLGLGKVAQEPVVDLGPVHLRVQAGGRGVHGLGDLGRGAELRGVLPHGAEVAVHGPGHLPPLLPQLLLPPRIRLSLGVAEVWSNPAHNRNYSVKTRII